MMATASQKVTCAMCDKSAGLFTCRGCNKDFCRRHVIEHQQELGKQLDELTFDHDEFRQNLSEQRLQESRHHPLMKKIDEWEQQSINKIHQLANDIRKQLRNLIDQHTIQINKDLTKIAQELRKAREDDDFHEIDLKQWMEKLNQLKEDLVQPKNISIKQEENTISFITKIALSTSSREVFQRSIGNIRIEDNGLVIIKDQPDSYATARGNGEYRSGQHRFRFKIDRNHNYKWLFIGIISKDTSMQENSYKCQSVCGWAGEDRVWLNGVHMPGFNGYKDDNEMNIIVELFIDCDKRFIRLTNERTHSMFELDVDTNKSPFPWQLNFNLHYSNDRVTILQ